MKALAVGLVMALCAGSAADAATRTFNRTNISGKTTKLDFFTTLNPDCTMEPGMTTRILQGPSRGKIKIVKASEFVYYAPQNPRHVCNSRRVPGFRVDYTSNPGYTGSDYLMLESITGRGGEVRSYFYITVK